MLGDVADAGATLEASVPWGGIHLLDVNEGRCSRLGFCRGVAWLVRRGSGMCKELCELGMGWAGEAVCIGDFVNRNV